MGYRFVFKKKGAHQVQLIHWGEGSTLLGANCYTRLYVHIDTTKNYGFNLCH